MAPIPVTDSAAASAYSVAAIAPICKALAPPLIELTIWLVYSA